MGLEAIIGRLLAKITAPRERNEDSTLASPAEQPPSFQHAAHHYYEAAKYYTRDVLKTVEEKVHQAQCYFINESKSYAQQLQDFSHNFPMPDFSWFKTDYNSLLGYTIPTLANTGKIAINEIAKASYALLQHIATHELFHKVHPYDWSHSWVYQMADYVAPLG